MRSRWRTATAYDIDGLVSEISLWLAGPLFVGVTGSTTTARADTWGLDPSVFGKCPDGTAVDAASLCTPAPSLTAFRLPADLVKHSELVVTGTLASNDGSVQLEVLRQRPEARSKLLPTATTVAYTKGMWTSNNQTVSYGLPVITRRGGAAGKRLEAAFEDFRQLFPAALCYTKIVPVDEVVTLTLYHREDEPLKRLILDSRQNAKLDRLWDELHYVSRDAIALVDVFE